MLGPWIKANWKWSNRRWQEWTSTFSGISEVKWTGMGEFNSDDHYIYYYGHESLWRNGEALTVNKRAQNVVLGCNIKNNRMISVCFQGKSLNIRAIQVYAQPLMSKKLELNGSMRTCKNKDLLGLLELTTKKDALFIIGDWNAKVWR